MKNLLLFISAFIGVAFCSVPYSCGADLPQAPSNLSSAAVKYTPTEIYQVVLKHEFNRINLPRESLGKRIERLNELLRNEVHPTSRVKVTASRNLNLELLCHEVKLDEATLAMLLKHALDSRKVKCDVIPGEIRLNPKK